MRDAYGVERPAHVEVDAEAGAAERDDLRLPEVQDNLGVRLLLLERRLAERSGKQVAAPWRAWFQLLLCCPF